MKRLRLVDTPLIIKIGFAPAFALVMLACLATGAIILQRGQAAELRQVVQVDMPNSLRMQKVSERITAVHGQLYFLLTHAAASIEVEKIEADSQAMLAEIDSIKKEVETARKTAPADQKKSYDELIKALGNTRDALDVICAMITADFGTAAGFAAPFEEEYGKMSTTLHKIVEAGQAVTDKSAAASGERAKTAQTMTMVGALATLLIAGALAVSLTLTLRRDVKKIAGATEALSRGDNSINLDALARKDELGAIVSSLTVFRDNQLHLEKLRQESETAEASAETARRQNAEAAAAIAEEQANVVTNLARALDALASGDLTYRVETEFPGDYRKLRDDFNAAVAKLEEAMTAIAGATASIQSGAGEISHSADDLSRRTEHQAATLEETAAALDQITATVNKTSEGATHGREATASAKTDAEQSGEIVRKAVVAMNSIQEGSNKISQIIGVVDEIAFQTNLLALNAGVEAARAGESGKGFAVVASEVRALAQRSAEAAKEIKALISASTQQVAEGVGLVDETGKALERIVRQVGEISNVVGEIAASAKEEALGLGQVNTAVNQMDQVTQQNAAMVEESTAASRVLADEAEELARLVGRFRVSGGTQAASRAPERQHAAPARHAPAPRSQAQYAPATRGNTALAQQPQAEDDSWEEF
ncbi:methyl-accepting chemotaxis protein [Phenylobacterium sp.]|uniref:methyl-accepting chemotaxis protein n=1 Tax=Phenylobacterium sp. TaxID=1871053 RepID=UPI00272016B5|nr:methyl-accepting chemotaxis protein [Phenylobacterium sp.]MDO8377346.1 methyl-accepting chemotaxis protein [Phenylobacterium sp.]